MSASNQPKGKFWEPSTSRSRSSSISSTMSAISSSDPQTINAMFDRVSWKLFYDGIIDAFSPDPIPQFVAEIFNEDGMPVKEDEAIELRSHAKKVKPSELKAFLSHMQVQLTRKSSFMKDASPKKASKSKAKSRKNSVKSNKRIRKENPNIFRPEIMDTSVNTEDLLDNFERSDSPRIVTTPTEPTTPIGSPSRSNVSTPIPPTDPDDSEEAPKIPKPLVVARITDVPAFTKDLHDNCTPQFEAKIGKNLLIKPFTFFAKKLIVEYLKQKHAAFHNLPDDIKDTRRFVIKGLRYIDPDLVFQELTSKGFKVISCVRMTSEKDKRVLPHLLVTVERLPNRDVFKDAKNISHMFHCKIQVDDYRPPRKVLQCYRCQQFNHRAKDCYHPERCVACSGEHNIKQCPRKTESEEENKPAVKCVNCDGNHPASYKGCKNFPSRRQPKRLPVKNAPTAKAPTMQKPVENDFPAISQTPDQVSQKKEPIPQPQSIYNPEEIKEIFRFFQLITRITREIAFDDIKKVNDKLQFAVDRVVEITDPTSKVLALTRCLSDLQG